MNSPKNATNRNMNFINDAVFMGRKDSIATPYLYPSILYHNKSGLYASGSFSYLTKSSESRIDLFLITAGYDFSIKKLTGDISFTKYFFNDDSYNVISEVEADLNIGTRGLDHRCKFFIDMDSADSHIVQAYTHLKSLDYFASATED